MTAPAFSQLPLNYYH